MGAPISRNASATMGALAYANRKRRTSESPPSHPSGVDARQAAFTVLSAAAGQGACVRRYMRVRRQCGGWRSVRLRVPSTGRILSHRFSSNQPSPWLLLSACYWTRPGSTTADSSRPGVRRLVGYSTRRAVTYTASYTAHYAAPASTSKGTAASRARCGVSCGSSPAITTWRALMWPATMRASTMRSC